MSYVLIVILICFSAFFSGTEIAYTSVNRVRLKKLAEDGSRMAKLADKISDKFDDALTAVLVGNNFVNIAASAVSTTIALSIARHTGSGHGSTGLAATIATVVITILILIFGEIVPKVVCKQNSDRAACLTAYPLAFFIIIFYPITFLVGRLLKLCSRFWGKPDDSVSEEELAMLIETTEEDGGIDEDKSDLLQSALEFSDITLAEVITHRTEVLALDVDANPAENIRIINSSRHSRLPVYKDSIDNIIGILNINQFYKRLAENPETTVKDVMFEPLMMHGTVKLPVALEEMREMQMPMTVVLDEYGGTLGIATIEDILEQIVGDIWDESDEIVEDIVENPDGTYRVLGDANIYDMFDEMDIDDRDFESDCNTVGGWCAEMLGQNPEVGMAFDYKNLHVEITRADETCVEEVCVVVNPVPEEEEE